MELKEEMVSQQTVYEGIIVNVRRDKARLVEGRIANREVVEHPGGVAVFAMDGQGRVALVRQFRYPLGEVTLELPAGKLERGEEPFAAMRREQKEETGTFSDHYVSLGVVYPTPAYDTEKIYLWAGRVSGWGEQKLDDGELLEVVRVPLDEAERRVLNNEFPDAKTQIGILKAAALVRAGQL